MYFYENGKTRAFKGSGFGKILRSLETDTSFTVLGVIPSLESVGFEVVVGAEAEEVGLTAAFDVEAAAATVFEGYAQDNDICHRHFDIGASRVIERSGIADGYLEVHGDAYSLVACVLACIEDSISRRTADDFKRSVSIHTNTSLKELSVAYAS